MKVNFHWGRCLIFFLADQALFSDLHRDLEKTDHPLFVQNIIAGDHRYVSRPFGPVERQGHVLPGMDDDALDAGDAGVKKAAFKQLVDPLLVFGDAVERVSVLELIDAQQQGVGDLLVQIQAFVGGKVDLDGFFFKGPVRRRKRLDAQADSISPVSTRQIDNR